MTSLSPVPAEPGTPAEALDLRETVAWWVDSAVARGDRSHAAALKVADNILSALDAARSTTPGPAPTPYALPDEPDVLQVWNDAGDSWCRLVRPLATGQSWVPWEVIDDETHIVEAALHWDELIAEQGRLSSVPPGTEASHGVA